MWELASPERKAELGKATPAQKEARERMALFPTASGGHGSTDGQGPSSEVIFVEEDKWVPVVRLGGKVRFDHTNNPRLGLIAAVHFPRYSKFIPTIVTRLDTISTPATSFCKAIPAFNLHCVSLLSYIPSYSHPLALDFDSPLYRSALIIQQSGISHRTIPHRAPSTGQKRRYPRGVM